MSIAAEAAGDNDHYLCAGVRYLVPGALGSCPPAVALVLLINVIDVVQRP